jgi:hypothetical protein
MVGRVWPYARPTSSRDSGRAIRDRFERDPARVVRSFSANQLRDFSLVWSSHETAHWLATGYTFRVTLTTAPAIHLDADLRPIIHHCQNIDADARPLFTS